MIAEALDSDPVVPLPSGQAHVDIERVCDVLPSDAVDLQRVPRTLFDCHSGSYGGGARVDRTKDANVADLDLIVGVYIRPVRGYGDVSTRQVWPDFVAIFVHHLASSRARDFAILICA